MDNTEYTLIKEYDPDLNKVRCPLCNKAIHGALDLESDDETYDFEFEWNLCPHFLFCELYSHGMEKTSERFDEIKDKFEPEDLESGEFTELFVGYNIVVGTVVLSINLGPSWSGHQIYYAFQPYLQVV